MSRYKIDKQDGAYFLTFTVMELVTLFEEEKLKDVICQSLNHCVEKKGLVIYAYVIMNTHMHLLAASDQNNLSGGKGPVMVSLINLHNLFY